ISSTTQTVYDTVVLEGEGKISASLNPYYGAIGFRPTPMGSYVDTLISFYNGGTEPLHVYSIQTTDSSFLAWPKSLTLSSSGGFSVWIRFAPRHRGIIHGQLRLTTDSRQSLTVIDLFGRGIGGWGNLDTTEAVPVGTILQNYPNPFNAGTTVWYGLLDNSHVVLELYDALGEKVASLVNEDQAGGWHSVTYTPPNLATGIYILRLEAKGTNLTKKIMIV